MRAAGKLPWWRMFGGDWLGDERLLVVSIAAEGAWIRLVCTMRRRGSGTLRLAYAELKHLLRQGDPRRAVALVSELQAAGVADVALDEEKREATITSRRVTRDLEDEASERAATAERVQRFRNGHATPPKRSRNDAETPLQRPRVRSQKSEETQTSTSSSPSPVASLQGPQSAAADSLAALTEKPSKADSVRTVLEHYGKLHPRARPGPKERRLVEQRLAEGYSAAELCRAIDGCHASPFHSGENDRHQRYQDLALILRDSTHVQRFLELAEEPKPGQKRPSWPADKVPAGCRPLEPGRQPVNAGVPFGVAAGEHGGFLRVEGDDVAQFNFTGPDGAGDRKVWGGSKAALAAEVGAAT